MIVIDNILVSDDVIEKQFVCDLNKCKGGCCEEGDAGAPLEDEDHLLAIVGVGGERLAPDGAEKTAAEGSPGEGGFEEVAS